LRDPVAARPPHDADPNRRRRPSVPWWGFLIGATALVALAGLPALLAGGGRPVPTSELSPGSSTIAAGDRPSVSHAASSSAEASPGLTARPTATGPGPTPTLASQPTPTPAPKPTPKPVVSATPTPRPKATRTPAPTPSPPRTAAWPRIGHIYEIVLENHEVGSIIGSGSAPYINGLARQFGLATNYTAVSHPSLPNYLALWSGSTQGVRDDDVHDFASGRTLADQITASGRTWHVAAENVPLGCFTGASSSGGEDGSGTYVRKHEPAISWTSVSTSPSRCARITNFSHFNPGLGNFWFIAPNLCHDMHDCSVATGDAWLKGFLPRILGSTAFKTNGLILLTFDEGSTDKGGGGKVATIVISPKARASFSSSQAHNHYSLLRTIEAVWGMPCMAKTCSANTLREFFP
jgi:hypothetical protein